MEITPNINNWLARGDRGSSSETIVQHLTGVNVAGMWGMTAPADQSDLSRCIKLIEAAPEIKEEFYRMREVGKVWSRFVDEWEDLVSLFLTECPNHRGSAPRTFSRMQQLGS